MLDWIENIFDVRFIQPLWLLGMLLVPVLAYLIWKKEQVLDGALPIAQTEEDQEELEDQTVLFVRWLLHGFKLLALSAVFIALAGPFTWQNENKPQHKQGIDIMLALDVSLSMFSRDFEPNRLEAAKRVAADFTMSRNGDRVGLVVYAGEAYTACPATTDYPQVAKQIAQATGEYLEQGTAIGVGLGTAIGRLQGDTLSNRVVILLTDGSNNSGTIDPKEAAELAHSTGVRVYTIGVGSNSEALSPVVTPFGIRFEKIPVEIDEETLQYLAERTGGKYYRAVDQKGLKEIYDEIDQLEKQRFLDEVYQGEPPVDPTNFLLIAISVLALTLIVEPLIFSFNHD